MTYLWDTDTFSWWQRRPDLFRARIRGLSPDDRVVLSAVTVFEAMRGRTIAVTQTRDEAKYARALAAFVETAVATRRWPILAYTPEAISRFAELRTGRGNRGVSDLHIAATALVAGAVLVTRNVTDFSDIPGLVTANWVD